MKQLIAFFFIFVVASVAAELQPLKIGDSAPKFTLKNYDGKEYSLQSLTKENKLVVMMFISTHCPVSNGYNERMAQLDASYKSKGVKFVGINANVKETVSDIASHCKEHNFLFPVLKDEGNKIADEYAAQVTPEIFVITPAGKIAYHGRIDDSRNPDKVTSRDLSVALDALLAGKQLTQAETKAFGCSIKRVSAE